MEERQTRIADLPAGDNGNGNLAGELAEGVAGANVMSAPAASGLSSRTWPTFEPVLDSQEAATLLHIHPKTLQRLARNGEIPGFRIGKLWGFRASALNEWLESKTSG